MLFNGWSDMKSILGREANMNNRKNSHNSLGKKTIGVLLMTVLVLSLMPAQTVNAAAFKKQKSKAKYKVTITNANSETVIEKGQKFKLQYNVRKIVGAKTSKTKAKFKSSNKKIATVSSKGVIKAKKKGTVKITVYCKKKPKKRKTIKIRVGTQVHSISLKGYQHLRVGRSTSIKATVNKNATNKKINWSSSNASIVRIDSKGKIKALKPGKATIYATAADGSGKSARIDIVVSSYKKSDANWIAHRGLHTQATENTADAFIAAGKAGFWGCECDIWETKHEIQEVAAETPDNTDENIEAPQDDQADAVEPSTDVANNTGIEIEGANEESTETQELDSNDEAGIVEQELEPSDMQEETPPSVNSTSDTDVETVETFDIVINHDSNFKRTMGVDRQVRDMTAAEIRNTIPKACFFGDYLDICKNYGMVPVVEFKDPYMSDAAIQMAVDMMAEKGLLQDAYLISFYSDLLERVNNCATERLKGISPYTAYLIGDEDKASSTSIQLAKEKGFECISISYGLLTERFYSECIGNGLKVGTWTYRDTIYGDEGLYQHVLSGKYNMGFITVDYKPY